MSTAEPPSSPARPHAAVTADPARHGLARMAAYAGCLWIACTLATAVAAELGRPGGLDLIRPTFSELIFTGPGARLVGLSMVSLAFASICVVFALAGLRAPTGRLAQALIAGWAGTLVVAAIFPMTPVGAPPVWHDTLHRYAALAGLVCLPVAGLRLARRFRDDPRWRPAVALLRPLSAASLLGVAAFLATFVPVDHPLWLLGARQYSGITERVPLAADLALLATLAGAVLRAAAPRRPGSRSHRSAEPGARVGPVITP
ncbi:DUF998 domain-containing protein [Sphaerisporangium album]|uniref:DUF998 domain-containing protein n=1 Tax=Sphaerisporangium album TaxID=509200 RepID=A0A367FDZ9_9ACTN|nr:DUF998 domain-containing protein [Sphaerisporangium album]RCG28593.1 DUF998 domain-containing protein [Sphaerisporangium album]